MKSHLALAILAVLGTSAHPISDTVRSSSSPFSLSPNTDTLSSSPAVILTITDPTISSQTGQLSTTKRIAIPLSAERYGSHGEGFVPLSELDIHGYSEQRRKFNNNFNPNTDIDGDGSDSGTGMYPPLDLSKSMVTFTFEREHAYSADESSSQPLGIGGSGINSLSGGSSSSRNDDDDNDNDPTPICTFQVPADNLAGGPSGGGAKWHGNSHLLKPVPGGAGRGFMGSRFNGGRVNGVYCIVENDGWEDGAGVVAESGGAGDGVDSLTASSSRLSRPVTEADALTDVGTGEGGQVDGRGARLGGFVLGRDRLGGGGDRSGDVDDSTF